MIIPAVLLAVGLLSPERWLMELGLLASAGFCLLLLWRPEANFWKLLNPPGRGAVFLGLALFLLLAFSSKEGLLLVLLLTAAFSWLILFFQWERVEGLILLLAIILAAGLARFRGNFSQLDILGLLILTIISFRVVRLIVKENEK